MNIQFSPETAQKACTALAEQSKTIDKNQQNLMEEIDNMSRVWSGDLATSVLGQLRAFDECLGQVRAYVDFLNNHIAACERNYKITETTAKARLKSIADLFL